jgi:hypothetical protein
MSISVACTEVNNRLSHTDTSYAVNIYDMHAAAVDTEREIIKKTIFDGENGVLTANDAK